MLTLRLAAIGLAGVVLLLSAVWLRSIPRRDVSIVDSAWGLGFVMLAWHYALGTAVMHPRALLLALLVTAWGIRLSAHIYLRHRGQSEDPRYAAIRDAWGEAFWWQSLFVVFWLQAALIWFIALPMLAVAHVPGPPLGTINDLAGLSVFAIGLAFEAIGDAQLRRFTADPRNRGRVLDSGLWRYTRHPNYFGDALLWWGLFVIATASPAGWVTFLSPALMTFLLLRISGVTLLERSLMASKPGYAAYAARTSAFFPWPPRD